MMLTSCLSCPTSFFVEPASIKPTGRRVHRGSVCRNEPSRSARLMPAAEAFAPDALVPDALVTAPVQSPEVPAKTAAAGEPINDAPDALPDGQEPAEAASMELEPAAATAVVELDAPIVPVDRDESLPVRLEAVAAPLRPWRRATAARVEAIPAADPHPRADHVRFGCRRLARRQRAAVAADRFVLGRDPSSPSAGNSYVLVRFFNRRDPVADLR